MSERTPPDGTPEIRGEFDAYCDLGNQLLASEAVRLLKGAEAMATWPKPGTVRHVRRTVVDWGDRA